MDRVSNRQSWRTWARQVHGGAWIQVAATANQYEDSDSVA